MRIAFQIIEILDSQSENTLTKVSHGNNQLTVIIPNKESKDIVVGKTYQAEMDCDKILDWKVHGEFDDVESGIWQEKDGIHLLGRVHNVIDISNGKTVIDIYIQNGPEFFTTNSEAMNNEIPNINAGLEIIVDRLYIFPNDK